MIAKIAADLGLEIVPSQADWAAVIEATTSGRNDVMLGAMGWTEERSKVMTPQRPDLLLRDAAGPEDGEQLQHIRRYGRQEGRYGDWLHTGAGAEGRAWYWRSQAL